MSEVEGIPISISTHRKGYTLKIHLQRSLQQVFEFQAQKNFLCLSGSLSSSLSEKHAANPLLSLRESLCKLACLSTTFFERRCLVIRLFFLSLSLGSSPGLATFMLTMELTCSVELLSTKTEFSGCLKVKPIFLPLLVLDTTAASGFSFRSELLNSLEFLLIFLLLSTWLLSPFAVKPDTSLRSSNCPFKTSFFDFCLLPLVFFLPSTVWSPPASNSGFFSLSGTIKVAVIQTLLSLPQAPPKVDLFALPCTEVFLMLKSMSEPRVSDLQLLITAWCPFSTNPIGYFVHVVHKGNVCCWKGSDGGEGLVSWHHSEAHCRPRTRANNRSGAGQSHACAACSVLEEPARPTSLYFPYWRLEPTSSIFHLYVSRGKPSRTVLIN
ncbi:hypothetical protein HW555_004820 [Spodoptera exigua]|uniref:Uncharacterized protein n=1 Tax=Spodoptera exigua TaxID=7107 RepID=A0A835L816_SPOEX|nr:hypothetical protein HW555_004820 [Spodoptera exigua]